MIHKHRTAKFVTVDYNTRLPVLHVREHKAQMLLANLGMSREPGHARSMNASGPYSV